MARQPLIAFVGYDRAQCVDPGVALRRHNAELGQMRPQGVDDLGALAYQHIARAVLHQLTLLFGRLDLSCQWEVSKSCQSWDRGQNDSS
jgi:hypothetical protein